MTIDSSERKPIIYLDHITRDFLKQHPDSYFIFGDNLVRTGRGGQAAEMRGEPNAIGVATKRFPNNDETAFFSDSMSERDHRFVKRDLMGVIGLWMLGVQIYASKHGLGTERAELKTRAPKLYNMIVDTFREMSDKETFPWENVEVKNLNIP